jgi:hypothetical protein
LLLALLIYWPGLTAWFQKDDFAWLGLRDRVHSWHDLWWALFAPLAQGTIRTLSERIFFMSFSKVFGMNPLPYRCLAFLTYAVSVVVLSAVCTRLTGSRAAGFWAAILWTVNSALAIPLSWTSVYYELLCSFILLLSFWLLLRYAETGESRFYIAQLVTFLLGFGVLELNVVYPALAAVYALCCARRIINKILPLFAISAGYTLLHIITAPLPANGPYQLHWDSSIISTFGTYWQWALGPNVNQVKPSLFEYALLAFLTLGLAVFLVSKLRRREWIAAFFPAWFLIVLAPLLPLRDHMSPEYLTIPLIGLAMLGGWALVSGWHAGVAGRIAVVLLLGIYLCVSIPVTRSVTRYYYDGSREIKKLVLGVAGFTRGQPAKMVLLKGVTWNMLWSALYHHPFRLFGIREVYLIAEDEGKIRDSFLGAARPFFIDPVLERRALVKNQAVVYDVSGTQVVDITTAFRASIDADKAGEVASKVEVGNDLVADQLGPTWYPGSGGWRWMPQHATVKLRGPRGPADKLYLVGFGAAVALKSGPIGMQVSVDGEKLSRVSVIKPDVIFTFSFDLPAKLTGRSVVEVAVDLDRTFLVPPGNKPLGLPLISFEIR